MQQDKEGMTPSQIEQDSLLLEKTEKVAETGPCVAEGQQKGKFPHEKLHL